MRLVIILAFIIALPAVLVAGEGLKTEYYEAAVNNAPDPTINYKRWTTSRDSHTILVIEERDTTRDSKWSQLEQIIMWNEKKVVHFLSLDGKRSVIYHPEARVKVVLADADGNGFPERISLLDNKDQTLDIFQIEKSGRITPISDQELEKWKTMMKDFSEAMKDF